MAEVIRMPRLSDTMAEGVLTKWHKSVGDEVKEGDILAEIETDKAIQEFESFYEGTLLYTGLKPGESAPVDALLAVIGQEGEDIKALIDAPSASAPEEGTGATPATVDHSREAAAQPVPVDTPPTQAAQATVIEMPRLSDTMTEGVVAKWHKSVGDKVEEGDLLAEIETDKAVQEFESFYEGTLLYIGVKEGERVPVGAILAIIGAAGTDVTPLLHGRTPIPEEPAVTAHTPVPVTPPDAKAAPQAATVQGASGRIFVSPLARKMAQQSAIDLSLVQGSGDQGRIVKRDIERFKAAQQSATPKAVEPVAQPIPPSGESQQVPVSQLRGLIAKRLSESKFTAPHYYLNITVDMAQAMAARKQANALPDVKISFNDMVVKAAAMALRKHPGVNSSWAGDHIILHADINIGVAVAMEAGLLVPVIKKADHKGMMQIASEIRTLAEKSKTRKIAAAEMQGNTFTISNLGMFGIESFTSIINQPDSCILSVGAILEKPVVKEGQIVVGHTMALTMACDHRTVDGATGAAFLQTLKAMLENPLTMML